MNDDAQQHASIAAAATAAAAAAAASALAEQREIQRAVGRVEGKLDLLLVDNSGRDGRIALAEARIGELTKKVWYMFGITNAITVGITLFQKLQMH